MADGTANIGELKGYVGNVGALKGIISCRGSLIGKISFFISDYDGSYVVEPSPREAVVLPTAGKILAQNVTVHKIPYEETSNISGITAVIGGY